MTNRFLAQCKSRLLYLVTILVAVSQGCNPATEESIGPVTEQRRERQMTQTRESDTEPPEPAGDSEAQNAEEPGQEQKVRDPVAVGGKLPPDSEADVRHDDEGQPDATGTLDHDAFELVDALQGEDAVARFLAEEQLIELGDAALPTLAPLASSPGDTPARRRAVNVLAAIGSEKAVNLLCHILHEEQDVMVRGLICQHLGRLGAEEAVPIIGKWLLTIQGKSFQWGEPSPKSMKPPQAWIWHVHALREIGSEEAVPILEKMLATKHGGNAGRSLMQVYRQDLSELNREVAFWESVRSVPGLERDAKLLFGFFRTNTLALMRLYRSKVIGLGLEGRWVLEDMKNHSDEKLRDAATSLLRNYDKLQK